MKRPIRVLIAAILLIAASCATFAADTKPPKWLLELGSVYPDAKYLAAIGSGDTRRGAESDAAGSLSMVFNSKVTLDSEAQQRYYSITSQNKTLSEKEMAVVQNVGIQSSTDFMGLKFSDPYTDKKGKVSIVAYLEREPTAALYKNIINKDLKLIDALKAKSAKETGVMAKYAYLDSAVQVSANSDRMLEQLRIIHPMSAKMLETEVDTGALKMARNDAAKKITFGVSIQGDKDGKVTAVAKAALAEKMLTPAAKGALSLTGVWTIEPVDVNPQWKSVRWTLDLKLTDEAGTEIATLYKDVRENAVSDAEARAFAYKTVETVIREDFMQALYDYMTKISRVN